MTKSSSLSHDSPHSRHPIASRWNPGAYPRQADVCDKVSLDSMCFTQVCRGADFSLHFFAPGISTGIIFGISFRKPRAFGATGPDAWSKVVYYGGRVIRKIGYNVVRISSPIWLPMGSRPRQFRLHTLVPHLGTLRRARSRARTNERTRQRCPPKEGPHRVTLPRKPRRRRPSGMGGRRPGVGRPPPRWRARWREPGASPWPRARSPAIPRRGASFLEAAEGAPRNGGRKWQPV